MKKNKYALKAFVITCIITLIFVFAACSSLVLKPADYSWPVESVLSLSEDGSVKEDRHNIVFDARELFLEETGDSSAYLNKDIRLIRDRNGYVYITSKNFKNVYIFENGEGELCLDNKVLISETGISNPAFNQRIPYIELIDGSNKYLLTSDGIEVNNEK